MTTDVDSLLDFSFDDDFAPSYKVLPEGKVQAVLVEFNPPKEIVSGERSKTPGKKWRVIPCTFEVSDGDWLQKVNKSGQRLTFELMLELTEDGKVAVPRDADDETNNGYRRFCKAMGGTTRVKMNEFLGKPAMLVLKNVAMKDRDGEPMIDDEGNQRTKAKVVAVCKAE